MVTMARVSKSVSSSPSNRLNAIMTLKESSNLLIVVEGNCPYHSLLLFQLKDNGGGAAGAGTEYSGTAGTMYKGDSV